MSDIIFAELNTPQTEAVKALSGPVLVLAGAGSGKTRVLTHRVANLIQNGVHPSEILAVTFTNKAAKEMQSRINKLLEMISKPGFGNEHNQSKPGFSISGRPTIGTFHAICVRILRQEIENLGQGLTRDFVIFDTADTKSLMKVILRERGYDEKEFKVKPILSHISSMKNQLISPSKHFASLGMEHNRFADVVSEIYPIYVRKLIEHNALDFDDLLKKTVEIFLEADEVLGKYRKRWRFVLVDEYQDTNFVQYKLIRLLTDEHKNLCVVGDDHQSIYAFRGADYTNILNFEADFPDATVIKLEQNYRSSANILNNANTLISHNKTGREKNLWTEADPGEPVVIKEVFDEREEGQAIAEQMKLEIEGGLPPSDIAVLYRMNAQSRAIEEALMRAQIPYQIVGGTRFFDRREIKDVIGYLRLIFNPKDDVSFLRVINVPSRKLGAATIAVLKKYSTEYGTSLFEILAHIDDISELGESKKILLRSFREMILKLQASTKEKPISLILDEVVDLTEFFKWLDDGTGEGEARTQNVRELSSVAGRYDSAENSIAAFLEGVALISDLDQMDDSESVTLMTMHAAKGLEFPLVFLPGWEEGIFPSSSSQFSPEQLEEERRLAYVAITRAEDKCVILTARQRMMFGKRDFGSPSQFLGELDEACIRREAAVSKDLGFGSRRKKVNFDHPLLNRQPATRNEAIFGVSENTTEYKSGDRIKHAEFGEGTIIMVSGDVIEAAFSGLGMKKIVASVAPIEKITET